MHQRSTQIPLVLLVAIFLNYGWELAQSPLYVGMDDFRVAISHCFVASVGDGFLLLGIVLAGRLV